MKNTFISFRAPEKLRAKLQELADKERRTLSQMATILIEDGIKDRQCRDLIRKAEGRDD